MRRRFASSLPIGSGIDPASVDRELLKTQRAAYSPESRMPALREAMNQVAEQRPGDSKTGPFVPRKRVGGLPAGRIARAVAYRHWRIVPGGDAAAERGD
jgi:hypothetical protein